MIERGGSAIDAVQSWVPMCLLAGAAAFLLAHYFPGQQGESVAGYRWVTCANTAMAAAAAVYAADSWLRMAAVGQAASLLAALGAIGIPLGLLADACHATALREAGPGFGLYEGTALFSAAVVAIYLAMERMYRSRSAALLIMPVVMLAVLCEMWLVARAGGAYGHSIVQLSGYWALGRRFSASLGHAALAAGAAYGCWVLLGGAGRSGAPAVRVEPMVGATAVGAPLLLVGSAMGVAWSASAEGALTVSAVSATFPASVAAFAMLVWSQKGRPTPRGLALCTMASFAVAVTGMVLSGWPGEGQD